MIIKIMTHFPNSRLHPIHLLLCQCRMKNKKTTWISTAVLKETVHKETVYKETVYKETVYKETVYKERKSRTKKFVSMISSHERKKLSRLLALSVRLPKGKLQLPRKKS